MKSYTAEFHGGILQRGFWIYTWQITDSNGKKYYYVGRTGDNASKYASSPFNRLSKHLEMRSNAKGNALYENILKAGLNPLVCDFKMYAFGPIYPEQDTFEKHKPYRDKMSAMEYRLHLDLKNNGFNVINEVRSKKKFPFEFEKQYDKILHQIMTMFK